MLLLDHEPKFPGRVIGVSGRSLVVRGHIGGVEDDSVLVDGSCRCVYTGTTWIVTALNRDGSRTSSAFSSVPSGMLIEQNRRLVFGDVAVNMVLHGRSGTQIYAAAAAQPPDGPWEVRHSNDFDPDTHDTLQQATWREVSAGLPRSGHVWLSRPGYTLVFRYEWPVGRPRDR